MSTEVKSMDIKKTQTRENALKSRKKVQDFVKEIKGEVLKVQWTSKEELLTYAKIVVMATLTFGMAIYLMDLLIQGTLNGLSFLLRLMTG